MTEACTRFPDLSIVVAVADNGVIGGDNKLLWRLKSDLKRFRALTMGKPIIMGRKTFQSIGKPLPGRITVVLTRDVAFAREAEALGVRVADSWDEALRLCAEAMAEMGASEAVVVGGAEIYALALPSAQTLHITEVHALPAGDAHFPDYNRAAFTEFYRENHPAAPDDEYPYTFVGLRKK